MGKLLTIVFAGLLILGRCAIVAYCEPAAITLEQIYKDIAHLFMGGLFVSWYHNRVRLRKWSAGNAVLWKETLTVKSLIWWLKNQPWQWRLFWVLNFVEIVAATVSRI